MDQKIKDYLDSLEGTKQRVAKILLDNLVYLTLDDMINLARKALMQAIEKYPDFNLFVYCGTRPNYECYISYQCKDLLINAKSMIISDSWNNANFHNNYPIFIISEIDDNCWIIDELRNSGIKNNFVSISCIGSKTSQTYNFAHDVFMGMCYDHLQYKNLLKDILVEDLHNYMEREFGCKWRDHLPIKFEYKRDIWTGYKFIEDLFQENYEDLLSDITREDLDHMLEQAPKKSARK